MPNVIQRLAGLNMEIKVLSITFFNLKFFNGRDFVEMGQI